MKPLRSLAARVAFRVQRWLKIVSSLAVGARP